MKATAGATAATAVGGATLHSPRLSPVGQSQAAIGWGVIVGTNVAAASWLLEEVDILGSDEPPDGLTDDVLKEQLGRTAAQRYSYEQSMFVDQMNLIQGAEHLGYDVGKRAAWDAINDGQSESDVVSAAQSAINDYFTPLYENLFKSWNEGLVELDAMYTLQNETDDEVGIVGQNRVTGSGNRDWRHEYGDVEFDQVSFELPDGSTFHLHRFEETIENDASGIINPGTGSDHSLVSYNPQVNDWENASEPADVEDTRDLVGHDGVQTVVWQSTLEWNQVFEKLEDAYTDAHDGITLWVNEVYGDVQAGEIDPSDLLNPRDIAGMLDEDEDLARAKADLLALNIPTDLNVEAKIETTLDGFGYTVVVSGMFAATAAPSGGFEAGETYTPNEGGVGSVHMVAHSDDLALEVPSGQYDVGLDGGVMEWANTLAEGYEYYIQTNNGETATIEHDDLEPVEDDWYYGVENWEVDLSDQLNDPIAEVEKVTGAPTGDQSVNITLSNQFEILEITDIDGDPVDTLDPIEPTEPHSDDNYLTQEDYEEMNDALQDRFDAIEEALDDSGGISGGGAGFIDDLTDFGASTIQTIVGGLILFILFIFGLNAASS